MTADLRRNAEMALQITQLENHAMMAVITEHPQVLAAQLAPLLLVVMDLLMGASNAILAQQIRRVAILLLLDRMLVANFPDAVTAMPTMKPVKTVTAMV